MIGPVEIVFLTMAALIMVFIYLYPVNGGSFESALSRLMRRLKSSAMTMVMYADSIHFQSQSRSPRIMANRAPIISHLNPSTQSMDTRMRFILLTLTVALASMVLALPERFFGFFTGLTVAQILYLPDVWGDSQEAEA